MAITINGHTTSNAGIKTAVPGKKAKSGHTQAKPYQGSLDDPGRFRVANWLALLNLSHSAFYARLKDYHKFPLPQPDGFDGRPYWDTATVTKYLQG